MMTTPIPGRAALLLLTLAAGGAARAHDPIFGLGPHVLYQGGVEIAPEFEWKQKGDEREGELALELTYGITGDWAAGIDIPCTWKDDGDTQSNGIGDVALFTKYRFWRHDTLGVQQSAALALKLHTSTGDSRSAPPTGSGNTDLTTGLAETGVGVTYVGPRTMRTAINGPEVDAMAAETGLRVDDPALVARRVVDAVARDRAELHIGFPERLFARVNGALPRLVDNALKKERRKMAPFALRAAVPQEVSAP